jgi:hypothetical protein
MAALTASCGRPADVSKKAAKPAVADKKCPDPSIHDSTNPCSPNYYKPVQGGFKGEKGL